MSKFLSVVLCLGSIVMSARADILVIRSVETTSLGGLGGSQQEMTQWTTRDRQREEHKSLGKTNIFEKMSGGNKPTITRLDKKLRWTLNLPKKTYEERALLPPPREKDASEPATESGESPSSDEKPTRKITKAEFKVKPLGQKKNIGGFDCEGYEMHVLLVIEDLESHETSEMKMKSILWTAPETGAVAQLKKDEEAYAKAYATAIGLTDSTRTDFKALGTAMVGALAGSGEKELSKALAGMPTEMKKIKGYPIATDVSWYGKGEGSDASDDDIDTTEMPTDVSRALSGLAKGLAKKNKISTDASASEEGQLILAIRMEIKSISGTVISPEMFEVPAGFKKAR